MGTKLLEQGQGECCHGKVPKNQYAGCRELSCSPKFAYACERADSIEGAIEAYGGAIDAQPRNFVARNNLGALYDKKGQHDAAIAELESALSIKPGNGMAIENLETARKNKDSDTGT